MHALAPQHCSTHHHHSSRRTELRGCRHLPGVGFATSFNISTMMLKHQQHCAGGGEGVPPATCEAMMETPTAANSTYMVSACVHTVLVEISWDVLRCDGLLGRGGGGTHSVWRVSRKRSTRRRNAAHHFSYFVSVSPCSACTAVQKPKSTCL